MGIHTPFQRSWVVPKYCQKVDLADPLDPRNWEPEETTYKIYLDSQADYFAVVDRDDDLKVILSKNWSLHYSSDIGERWRGGEDVRHRMYARSATGMPQTLLHRFVMRNVRPPTPNHIMVDHLNGQGLDCRKSNLRWATPHENGLNKYGYLAKVRATQYELDI